MDAGAKLLGGVRGSTSMSHTTMNRARMPRDRTTKTRGTPPSVVSEFTEAIDEGALGVPPDLAGGGSPPHRPVLLNRAATAFAVDVVMVALTVLVLELVSPTESPSGAIPTEPLGWSLGFSALILAVFFLRGMYALRLRQPVLDELKLVTVSTAIAAATLIAIRVIMQNDPYVAAETVRHSVVAIALVTAGRGGLLWAQSHARRRGVAARPTLIVGAGHVGHMMARRLLEAPELGLRPVGFLDANPLEVGERPRECRCSEPRLGLRRGRGRARRRARDRHLLDRAARRPAGGRPRLLGARRPGLARPAPVRGGGRARHHAPPGRPADRRGEPLEPHELAVPRQGAVDRVGSVVLIVLLAPLLAILALAVRLTMGSPDPLPPAPHGPRRTRLHDAQVPHHGASATRRRPKRTPTGREEQLEHAAAPARAAAVANRTHARRASCCGASRWTSCRSCGTSCAARCR